MPDNEKPVRTDTGGCAGDQSDPLFTFAHRDIAGQKRRLDDFDLIDDVGEGPAVTVDNDGISVRDLAETVEDRALFLHAVAEDHEISFLSGLAGQRHPSDSVAKLDLPGAIPERKIAVDRRDQERAV